jgi:hypothetical protein
MGDVLMSQVRHGRVFFNGDKSFIIDAEPHVMTKIRNLFISRDFKEKGQHTPHPIEVTSTLSNCRDLDWVMSRYHLEISQMDLEIVVKKSIEYEKLLSDVSSALGDKEYRPTQGSLHLNVTLRSYQSEFVNFFRKVGNRTLNADVMGVGKTIEALAVVAESDSRPAIIIVPSTILLQWEKVIKRVLPDAKLLINNKPDINEGKLSEADIILTTYGRVSKLANRMITNNKKIVTVVMDEIQNLRHEGTERRSGCLKFSNQADKVLGLSGTPIYNSGIESYSILKVIDSKAFGTSSDFEYEWCGGYGGNIKEPSTFFNYVKSRGLMIRREKKDVGLEGNGVVNEIIELDASLSDLADANKMLKILALGILELRVGDSAKAQRDFDIKMRHATGVAKAKPVAEFVKMLLETEERVMITAWHREVYEIYQRELKDYGIAMVTGTETPIQKANNIERFLKDEGQDRARILIISHISGAGIDELQYKCSILVNGELAWSRKVHEQILQRLDRPGQVNIVKNYWPIINDGSDPLMVNLHVVKDVQANGFLGIDKSEFDLKMREYSGADSAEGEIFEKNGPEDVIKLMAQKYLKSNNIEIPVAIEETELTQKLRMILKNSTITFENEDDIQRKVFDILSKNIGEGLTVEREVSISKKSRVDILIKSQTETIIVEIKKNFKKKTDAYRQVRRYIEEINPTAVVIVAPWVGISDFKIENTPVLVISSPFTNL